MPPAGWRKPNHLLKHPRRSPPETPATPADGVTRVASAPPESPEPEVLGQHHTYGVWSLTLSKRGGHIPDSWYTRCCEFLDLHAIDGAIALEAGGRKGHLHVQGVLGLHASRDEEGRKKLEALIREFVPVPRGSGAQLVCKPAVHGQTMQLLLGYVQKDVGKAHFRIHLKGVTEQQAAEAALAHQSVSIDPMAGRKVLTKTNLMRDMYAFYWMYLRPLHCSAER